MYDLYILSRESRDRGYFFVKRNSVSSEKTNAMNNKRRYPRNSSSVPIIKNPMIMMITAVHIPAIIRCLLSIRYVETLLSLKTYPF